MTDFKGKFGSLRNFNRICKIINKNLNFSLHKGLLNKKFSGPFGSVTLVGLGFQARHGLARHGPRRPTGRPARCHLYSSCSILYAVVKYFGIYNYTSVRRGFYLHEIWVEYRQYLLHTTCKIYCVVDSCAMAVLIFKKICGKPRAFRPQAIMTLRLCCCLVIEVRGLACSIGGDYIERTLLWWCPTCSCCRCCCKL